MILSDKFFLINIFIIMGMLFVVNGLKCRLENDIRTQEEFEDVVKNCLNADNNGSNNRNKNNNNNNNNYNNKNNNNYNNYNNNNNNNYRPWNQRGNNDQRNQNNRDRFNQNDENRDRDGDRYNDNRRGNNSGRRKQPGKFNNKDNENDYDYDDGKWHNQDNNNNNNNRRQSERNNGDTYSSSRRNQNDDSRQSSDTFNKFFNTSRKMNTNIGSPLEDIDACVIHCIFRQMKMASDESYINRNTVLNVLTRRIRDQELKSFVQESVNDCFENLDQDEEEICDFSKSFAMCIEEKGKSNCDDWDITKFGNRNKDRNNNNNKNRNTFQQSPSRG